jgi:hypothetical protein
MMPRREAREGRASGAALAVLPFHDVCHSVGRRNASADGDPELLPLARYYFQDAEYRPIEPCTRFMRAGGAFIESVKPRIARMWVAVGGEAAGVPGPGCA